MGEDSDGVMKKVCDGGRDAAVVSLPASGEASASCADRAPAAGGNGGRGWDGSKGGYGGGSEGRSSAWGAATKQLAFLLV